MSFQTKCKYLFNLNPLTVPVISRSLNRNLWAYVAIAFNKVDNDRLNLVGPDRLCAEWVLKNGGAIEFGETAGHFIKDYNALPADNKLRVRSIDASNSSIMKIGFDHLKGCNHIHRVILHQCKHLESGGLSGLLLIKKTLKVLQVSGCDNLKDTDFDVLKDLKVLEDLTIADVKNLQNIVEQLKKSLPNCSIKSDLETNI